MIYDVITFNNEVDLLELRLNILNDFVDYFVIVEFDKTFSGQTKPYYFKLLKNKRKFKKFWKKIIYCPFNDELAQMTYMPMALQSPNTKGASHWLREFCQKETIQLALQNTRIHGTDVVFVGDCDEIWDPSAIIHFTAAKIKLKVYTYYLNNRSSEEFWGTIVAPYSRIKYECLNHLRTSLGKTVYEYGWHFTSLKDGLEKKLKDSYTKETYANEWVMDNLQSNIENNKDFLGRGFTYTLDEKDWPKFLADNRERYAHLIKNES